MAVLKDLIVHGASRFLGDVYFNFLKANDIAAETGYFKKLTAIEGTITDLTSTNLVTKNATVTALLDVQGDMHTNSWSNSNIATIDGSFYITPTSISTDGSDTSASNYTPTGTIAYTSPNFTKISVTGTFDTSQLVLDSNSHVPWPASSEVIITGDVLVGNEWLPLGTIRGKLESQVAATNASKTISIIPLSSTLTDGQGHNPVTLEAIRVGINLTSGTSSSLKMRKVKISLTSRANGSNQYPVGILLSAQGTGTGQTFIDIYGGNSLRNGQSGTINGATKYFTKPVVRIGNLEGLPKLANQTPSGWGIYTSNGFFEGAIVAKEGYIGNTDKYWTIGGGTSSGATYMYCGPSTISATSTAGTYLGTDGFLNAASTTKYAQITNGVLTAKEADISGKITANSGFIGGTSGWTIAAQQISSGSIGQDNSMFLATKNLAGTISGTTLTTTAPSWRLTVGSKFGVDNTGKLYATGADISGAITSTNGFYVKTSSTGDYIAQMTGTGISLGNAGTNGSTYTTYNIQIDPNTSTGGILLRKGTQILNKIDSSGMTLYDGTASNDANIVANFGKTISLGRIGGSRINLNTNQFIFYDKNDSPYFELNQGAAITTTILRTTTLQIAIDQTDFSGSTEYTLNSNELTAYNNNTLQVSLSDYSRRLGEASYAFETTNGTTKIRVYFYANEYVSGVSVTLKTYQTTGESKASLSFGSREGEKGSYSIVMGLNCIASKTYTFAAGNSTKAEYENQFVIGKYNNNNSANVFEIGWGTSSAPKNILEVNTSGNVIDGSGTQLVNKAMIDCGTTGGLSMAGGATNHTTISFHKTFSSAPNVVVSIYSESTYYTDIGKCSCWVTNITTTGCTIYTYNGSSNTRAPAVRWQAMLI